MKKCNKCLIIRDVSNFSKDSCKKDGLQNQCKVCKKKQAIKWKKINPEYLTTYWDNHIEVREKQKISNKMYHTKIKGVYGIYEKGKCLYVGKSNWFNSRKATHHYYFNNPQNNPNKWWGDFYTKLKNNHCNIIIGLIEECSNNIEQEKYWINKLNPLYNKNGRTDK
jgi:hypothetical protein